MIKKFMLLFLCSTLFFVGCSTQQTPISDSVSSDSSESADVNHSPVQTDPGSSAENTDDTANTTITPNTTDDATSIEPHEKQTVSLVMGETNGNEKISVTLTGLCQYDTLESDAFTDTPDDGNVYLVMFLDVINYDDGDDYINPGNLSATVDGKTVAQAALFNQPQSYEPIFNHISSGEQLDGFIAWQVPADWQSFEMIYDGWDATCGLTVTAKVTPDMLSLPPSLD